MEIITGSATDLIGKIFGYVGSTVGRQVGYLIHYKRNLENLQNEVAKLRVAKQTVSEKITDAEAKGEKIHSKVQVWLKDVAKTTKQAEGLLKDKQQATADDANNSLKDEGQPKTECVHGFCPNPMLRRRRSKKSLALIEDVTKLINEERELSDISYLPPKDLQTEVDKLNVAKRTVAEKVTAAAARGEKIHAKVQDWLKRVDEIIEKAEAFLKDKHQPIEEASELKDEIQAIEKPDTSLSHGSKESLELLQVVTELYEMREFSDISYVLPAEDVCIASDEDYEEFDSRTSILEKILKELGNSSSEMILVYGVGGVGKTTLVEEVLRKTQKEKFFEDAVMVRDVKIPNLEAIQNQIAEKLGLSMVGIQTPSGRANNINERIKDKKTLVIFDDVWGELDLKAVGLPHKSTCRILLTSRSQQVFSHKIKQKGFPLGVLDDKEAWALFEKKAGDVVADPTIQPIATQVAKKCGGLPVLIITVARALENKTLLPIWKDALRSLERFDEEGDLTEKAYSGIKWSYEQLSVKDQLRPLFLLCGLIAKGNYASFTDLLKYSIGLGLFEDCTVEDARNALYQQVDKLKSSCLLLDDDDGLCVRMHDLVRDVAIRIARRDHHVLVEDRGHEREKWPNEDFFIECSKICLPCCNIATLPQVPWQCPKSEMFHLHHEGDDSSPEIPSNFFVEMKNLKVLGLSNVPLLPLPPSISFLKNLQTLCLDGCMFEDIALVGELRNLEVLSLVESKVKQLPKEIGQLTRLRLVDLSDCYELKVIPAGVISNWTRLEDLRMRNSFNNWESREVICETSNASLLELMNLPKLTALEVHIPDTDILPAKFFSDRLEKYQIFIVSMSRWYRMYETTVNKLILGPNTRYELDQGLKALLKRCGDLRFIGAKDVDFSFILKTEVVMSSLTTLEVSNCDGLKYFLSSSMARSLVKLKQLKISNCKAMEEIVSTRESQNNIISKLEILELNRLPNLARFCTAGSCIEFPSLERLYMRGCSKLGESNAKDTTFRREIQERELDENFQAHYETSSQNFLFDEKIRSPRLKILQIISYYNRDYENRFLQTIWHNQLDPCSFCRLREVCVQGCVSLRSIFPPSMMGRLSGLETLDIKSCESMEVLFDERRETNVNETHGTSTTQLKDGQNLKSVDIYNCHRLKYIFPASMVTGGLQQLQKMKAGRCDEMESVVAKEEGTLESTRHPNFVFPKVESMIFESMQRLKSFYPGMYISEWPLLKHFKFEGEVEIFAAELSAVFQERQIHAPTKQPFLLIDKSSFPVLEKLEVSTAEILYGCGETVRVGSLPRVRVLKLSSVDVRHLGIENQPAGPVFPNLESLNVTECCRLENLVSSAVSFRNLTTLEVYRCDGLKCLAPSSVAKSLVQLTNLTVTHCKEIVVLVAGNEDEDDDTENEIAFSRLQYLKLSWLRSLQGFCSGNCIAKLPLSITVNVIYCPIQLKISPDGVPIAESRKPKYRNEDEDGDADAEGDGDADVHGDEDGDRDADADGDGDADADGDGDGDGDEDGMKMEMEMEDTADDDHSTAK